MTKKALHTGLIHEELEPRLLFSAGLETVLLDDNLPGTESAIIETVSESETEILLLEQNQQANSESEPASEVIFIDENVENYDQLMADLANRDNIDVYILDTSADGIEQISAVLEGYQDLDAIHLFSHGNEQGLLLGNGALETSNLANYSDAITGWQSALSENADLLIYGCDLASGSEGQALLASLQELTGTDVAASDDLTGQAALGGDWDLEYQAGEIETAIAFSAETQQDWAGVLANSAPSGTDNTIITQEDTAYTFSEADFGFTDGDGDLLSAVKFTTVPTPGSLTLSGVAVSDGDSISETDISAGNLVFTPVADANGTGYTSFTFQVQDDGGTAMGGVDLDQSPNTMTIDVTAVNDNPTGGVSITGTVTEDQTLTADTSALVDIDGLGAFTYTWQRDGVDIASATASTYTLTDADVGTSITATVAYTDSDGTAESVVSTASAAVANVNDSPTGGVSITGTVTEDQTLTADTSALIDNDGLGTYSYTWQRDGVDIASATASTYTLTDADVGTSITATVAYTDSNGTAESVVSTATAAVANVNDNPTGGVSITGTVTEDQTLTADTSALADADGLGAFSYTWQRDGVDIGGATANTYTLTDADVGAAITVTTNYTDSNGTAESVVSSASSTVASASTNTTSSSTEDDSSSQKTSEVDYSIEPVVSDLNTSNLDAGKSSDPEVTEAVAEESSRTLSEADAIVDIDADSKPTLILKHGYEELNQALATNQTSSDADNITLVPATGLTEVVIQRIESQSSQQFDSMDMNPFLQNALNELNLHLGSDGNAAESDGRIMVTTITGASIVLTTAYVSWAMQSGSMVAALTKTLPAWNTFDPLAILNALTGKTP